MNIRFHVGGGISYPFRVQVETVLVGDATMQMSLQFGHGMIAHTRRLLEEWGDGGAILSPRDLTDQQLTRVAGEISAIERADVLLDPQCYSVDADHRRLTEHPYWKSTVEKYGAEVFDGGRPMSALLSAIADLNRRLNTSIQILPAPLAKKIDDNWGQTQEAIIEESVSHFDPDARLLATIALSNDVIRDNMQIEKIVNSAEKWNVHGCYVVAESPDGYLVDDPKWLGNLMILIAGLKLARKYVLVGYSSHQMLCLAAAHADSIASGTWLNVRAFAPERFFKPSDDEVSRRTTWYYCPTALSEYKIPFLDIASDAGYLDEMVPDGGQSKYARPLFQGARPSDVSWGEQDAFRHYLTCLRSQCISSSRDTFDGTFEHLSKMLDDAALLLKKLRTAGVFGQDRDFTNIIEVNRSALIQLRRVMGKNLRHHWSDLSS